MALTAGSDVAVLPRFALAHVSGMRSTALNTSLTADVACADTLRFVYDDQQSCNSSCQSTSVSIPRRASARAHVDPDSAIATCRLHRARLESPRAPVGVTGLLFQAHDEIRRRRRAAIGDRIQ
jgi:hypothetical protein